MSASTNGKQYCELHRHRRSSNTRKKQRTGPARSGLFFHKKFLSAVGASLRGKRTGSLVILWVWSWAWVWRLRRDSFGSLGSEYGALVINGAIDAGSKTDDFPTNYAPTLDTCPNCLIIPCMETDVLTTEEAAERLQVSARTIRRMIDRGTLHAYKMDPGSKSVYQIPLSEINRILGERKNQGDQSTRER